jgi:hypothetical protein
MFLLSDRIIRPDAFPAWKTISLIGAGVVRERERERFIFAVKSAA